ncbi:hypothetical protein C1H76_1372 [Elsinoe australis]|uniref:Uncharacterized protein n=1 Tax=Elsinoe australis TaxID=40998 RepID=A0A4U7B9V2_9PEZI|nr:hypothetical protein C1H76_1372 [Elsinoe australis]
MAEFQPLFKTSEKPRWQLPNGHNFIRSQFNIETFALAGAVLQSALILVLPLRLAILPAFLLIFLKIADVYAQKFNLKTNPHMANNIVTKFSAQFPGTTGSFGNEPARSSMCVFLIGARNNSPLGLFNPRFKELGDFFQRMNRELEETATESGFLGASNWTGTERASNAAGLNVMYFRSAADVHAYAHGPLHRQAWDWWYKNLGDLKELSIFHELYEVPSGNYESVYEQMPPMLAAATQHRVVKEENGEKKEEWQIPVVDARKGQLKSSKGRMARSGGKDNDKYGIKDIYDDVKIEVQEAV